MIMQAISQYATFEIVARHLFAQGKQAKDGDRCLYRMNDMKCAIGCLITDDEHSPWMERTGLADLYTCGHLPNRITENNPLEFLAALQNVHDRDWHWKSTDTMQCALKDVAADFCMTVPVLDELKFADR